MPEWANVYFNWSIMLASRGDCAGACEKFQHAAKLRPEYAAQKAQMAEQLLQCGHNFLTSDKNQEAIGAYDSALRLAPDCSDAWENKAFAQKQLGQYLDAISSADRALMFAPTNLQARTTKGLCLFQLDRFSEAVECFDKVTGMDPKNASVWLHKAPALGRLERYEEAVGAILKFIAFAGPKYAPMVKEASEEMLPMFQRLAAEHRRRQRWRGLLGALRIGHR